MSKYDENVDIIRMLAFISLVSVHYIGNAGLYDQIVAGKLMFLVIIIRTLFLICVPLFIIITGYLQSEKRIELTMPQMKRHLYGIKNVIYIYTFNDSLNLF